MATEAFVLIFIVFILILVLPLFANVAAVVGIIFLVATDVDVDAAGWCTDMEIGMDIVIPPDGDCFTAAELIIVGGSCG